MKKLIALLLALIMVLSVAACSSDSGKDAEKNDKSQSQNKNDDKTDDKTDDKGSADDDEDNKELAEFEEIVVVDNDECIIKITGIDPHNMWGYTVKAYFENKSADKTYMFSVDGASINGVQSDPFFAAEVAAGKKSNEEIVFNDDLLAQNGIEDFTDIKLSFSVSDSEDWSADPVADATVHVYPYGEDQATKFVRESQDNDQVLVDNEYITLIATGNRDDELWGYTVDFYLVNKTDKNLTFAADDVSVNGFMVDPLFVEDVNAGNCAFGTMEWVGSELEDNGITSVEEIEFILSVYDLDDWSADDLVEETIKFNP